VLRIGLFCRPHQLPGGDLTLFGRTAQLADRAGFHSIHLGEHVVMGPNTDRYPFGAFEHAPGTAWPDPLLTLAAAAAVTDGIRLSTGVLLAPLRPGPALAKTLATLDVLSSGRAEPGVGIGWQREEFEACGVSWESRYTTFDEALRMCRRLWDTPAAARVGAGRDADAALESVPRPVQARLPLLLGLAPGRRTARRIAEFGDGWCPVRLTPPQVSAGLAEIRAAMQEAGRSPDSLIVRVQAPLVQRADGRMDVERTLSCAPDFERAGATVLAVGPTVGCRTMSDVANLVDEIARVAPQVGLALRGGS